MKKLFTVFHVTLMKHLEKKYIIAVLMFLILLGTIEFSYGQTVLLSPTGDGGFETGTSLSANGWSVANNATNYWVVGTTTYYAGSRAGYISTNGTNNSYTNTLDQTSHIYRDISVPSGENLINLSFYYKGAGEVNWDRLLVYTAPTSVTPVAGSPASQSTTITGATLVFTQTAVQSSYVNQQITLPSSLAGTTFRLIFTWQNDDNTGSNPPAAVDNISVTSQIQTTFTTAGTYSLTVPAGVTCIKAEAWGGGGGGGGGGVEYYTTNVTRGGGGGGGGAYNIAYIPVNAGQNYSITVGAAGTVGSGTNGGNGENSTVSGTGGSVTANGGKGGVRGTSSANGTGGAEGTGGIFSGGTGGTSTGNGAGGGGGAGNGPSGDGGDGGNATTGAAGSGTYPGGIGGAFRTNNGNGRAAGSPGGGGGGARSGWYSARTGGTAGAGQVIISWAINVSNFSTSASTPVCAGNTSTVTVTSTSLASNTYTVIYNLSGANTATGNTATLVFSGGTGNFTTSALANSGATTVTITGLDLAGWGCTSTVSSGNTAGITVNANLSAVNVTPNSAQSICIGGSGSQLTAAETGGGSITGRQWGKRSTSGGSITNISGATGSTYTPSGSDLGTGTWYVVCTSTPTCGSATTSNEVTVVVNANLSAVNIAPTGSQIFCLGTSGTQLSAAETGGGSITGRQWGKRTTSGGTITDISGATGSTYTPTGADLGEGTWYVVCRSTPTCGSVGTSNEVTVTVNPHSWTGTVNNDWKEEGNWCGGVPTASTNVVIPGSATVHVTNDAGSPAECNNLTIESGGVLTIDAGKALTVYGSITKSSNDNDLVIKSDASGTGSLLHSTTGVHATLERYIDNSGTSYHWDWHLLASPVASQAIWPQFAPTPTYLGPNNWNLSWGSNPQWDFYYYNPNCPLTGLYWVNLRWTDNTYNYRDPDLTNSDAGFGKTVPPVMIPSRGYLAAYYSETGTTHQFAGTLNTGSQSYSATNQNDYYNLVGNPYPSYIDWQSSSLTRTNLEDLGTSGSPSYAFWIWNEDKGNYGAFTSAGGTVTPPGINGTSRYIAPSQGFFVKANSKFTTSTQIIGFSQSARTHATQGWLKDTEAATNYIKLVLTTAENTYSDELVVFFDENNNGDYGVEKLASWNSDAPELYSVKEGTEFCIDMLKGVTHSTVINVSAKCGVSGNYTIAAPGINEFALCDEVYLEDLLTGNKIDLRQINSYSFAGGPNDDRARFKLTFAEFAGTNETETIKPLYIYSVGKDVYINANQLTIGRSDVFIYDALGRLVYRGVYTPAAGNVKHTSLITPGAYVVKAITRTGTITAKIIIP